MDLTSTPQRSPEPRRTRPRGPIDSNAAAARLRDAIISGRFMPNERLVEQDLVTLLKTNRANLRTALARLEQEGLVVTERNRGARVRLVTEVEAAEILEARGALEGLVARQAAMHATDADRVLLRDIITDMRRSFESGDMIAYSECNGRLHAELQRISGNSLIARLLDTLASQLVRYQFRTILITGRAAQSFEEHVRIVDAVCAGDGDAAERVMHEHLHHILAALKLAIGRGQG